MRYRFFQQCLWNFIKKFSFRHSIMKVVSIFLLSCLISSNHGFKVLGVLPFGSKSHFAIGSSIINSLHENGHEVTVISPFPKKAPVPKYKDISLADIMERYEKGLIFQFLLKFKIIVIRNFIDSYIRKKIQCLWAQRHARVHDVHVPLQDGKWSRSRYYGPRKCSKFAKIEWKIWCLHFRNFQYRSFSGMIMIQSYRIKNLIFMIILKLWTSAGHRRSFRLRSYLLHYVWCC